MSIRITNLLRTAQTFNIPRDIAPVRKHYARVTEHKDGTIEKGDVRVVHGDSLTVLGTSSTTHPVPSEWRTTPDIAKAARARTITIEDVPEEAAPALVLEAAIDEEPVVEKQAEAPAPVQQKSSGKGGSR